MPIEKIVIHCSDSPHGRGDDAATIHNWHKERGWDGIGYHLVILEDGAVEPGRPWYWTGAHVRGHNENSLGICLIGKEEFAPVQMDGLYSIYKALRQELPHAVWYNHFDLDPSKTCPNIDAVHYLETRLELNQ